MHNRLFSSPRLYHTGIITRQYRLLGKRRITPRFGHLFQVSVSGQQQAFHVACEEEHLSHLPKHAQWRTEGEQIDHECPRWLRDKLMEMGDFRKRATDHFVGKTIGSLIGGNFCGQVLLDAKMYRFLGHGITQLHLA